MKYLEDPFSTSPPSQMANISLPVAALHGRACQYMAVAGYVSYLYDLFLTFDQEVCIRELSGPFLTSYR